MVLVCVRASQRFQFGVSESITVAGDAFSRPSGVTGERVSSLHDTSSFLGLLYWQAQLTPPLFFRNRRSPRPPPEPLPLLQANSVSVLATPTFR